MNTPLHELTDTSLNTAKKCLQDLDLDNALKAIDQSLKKRQQDSGSDLSFYGNILWCEILLTKGRFLKDITYATLAFNKLSEAQTLIPQIHTSIAFLPFHLLMGTALLQLNKLDKAQEVYSNILTISKEADNDIGQIQALNALATLALNAKDTEKALLLANQSLELLIQHTDEENYDDLVRNYLLQSEIFLRKNDLSQAKNYGERALKIAEERALKELMIAAHILLGRVTIALKEHVLAITHLLTAKEESLSVNHKAFLASTILYSGIVYNHVFHYPKALQSFKLVEENYTSLLDNSERILLLNYLGKSYFQSSQNEESEQYFLAAEKLAKQHNDKFALMLSLSFLGAVNSRKTEYNKALRYAKRVDTLTKQIGDADGVQVNLLNLGNVHNKLEKYNEGIKLASRGIAAAKRMKDGLSEIRGYQIMAEIFRKKKDFKSAVMYQMIYTKFYEDFYQRNDRQQVAEMEHQFAIKKLEQKIEALTKK